MCSISFTKVLFCYQEVSTQGKLSLSGLCHGAGVPSGRPHTPPLSLLVIQIHHSSLPACLLEFSSLYWGCGLDSFLGGHHSRYPPLRIDPTWTAGQRSPIHPALMLCVLSSATHEWSPRQGLSHRQSTACPCSCICQADCLQNVFSLRSCKRWDSVSKELTVLGRCTCLVLFHILLQHLGRQTDCLQRPEHAVQNLSLSWAGAACWTKGLIWARSKFCPDSISTYLPASYVKGRIPPQLEPNVRLIKPTHSWHVSFRHMWSRWSSQTWRNHAAHPNSNIPGQN